MNIKMIQDYKIAKEAFEKYVLLYYTFQLMFLIIKSVVGFKR
jgi:hypothetical protein